MNSNTLRTAHNTPHQREREEIELIPKSADLMSKYSRIFTTAPTAPTAAKPKATHWDHLGIRSFSHMAFPKALGFQSARAIYECVRFEDARAGGAARASRDASD